MAKLYELVFSPTGGSRKVSNEVLRGMNEALGLEVCSFDLSKVKGREGFSLKCEAEDVVLLAFPVYTGRMPLTLRETIDAIDGGGARLVVAATYGNRHYGDALREAFDFMSDRGFAPVAVGAFSAEHSFTANVAAGRPDADDLVKAHDYGRAVSEKLSGAHPADRPEVPGDFPYADYHGVMPFHPETSEACVQCGACVDVCPMDNVDAEGFETGSNCIQCGACIKVCPAKAKAFVDAPLLGIIGMLEGNCLARREPEFFL